MKKNLVVIDMQNDFITGTLPADGGVEIVPRIVDKIKNGDYDRIIYTKDIHSPNEYKHTLEGKNIPEHCVTDTEGQELNQDIFCAIAVKAFKKETKAIEVKKDTFGSFLLSGYITSDYDYDVKGDELEIELCGVCTDICVISNALILRTFYPNARIVVDSSCCAGSTKEAHKTALTVMRNCLIEVV